MDGRTATFRGFKSELWAGLALVLTVLALALYALQTALFIDLAVWVQTQGKELVVNAVRANPDQWLHPTVLVVTETKHPQNRQIRVHTLRWGSLSPIGDIKSPLFSLIYSDPLESGLDVLVLRTHCGQPQCAEDIALLTADWATFSVGHRWPVPTQRVNCKKRTPTEVRYYSQINRDAPGELMRIQSTPTLTVGGGCENQIQVARYVVTDGRLTASTGPSVIE